MRVLTCLIGLLLMTSGEMAQAQDGAEPKTPAFGAIHEFKDWEIACDNGHRCAAVGYAPEDAYWEAPAAIFIARDAGPNGEVQIKIVLGGDDSATVNLMIGSFHLDAIQTDQPLPASAINAAVAAITKGTEAKISVGKKELLVSLNGATAALLKMDDLQGRIDTPGALVRRGIRPESSVPPAPPIPVVRRVPFLAPRPGDDDLVKPIVAALGKAGCDSDENSRSYCERIFRVSQSRVLLTKPCWMAAYQGGSGAWLANDRRPYAPVKLQFPDTTGLHDEEPTELEIEKDGKAFTANKSRGFGDCGWAREFAWNGHGFDLVSEYENDLCRGIHGDVALQLWRAEVRQQ